MPRMLSADSSRATEKIVWGLSRKITPSGTIYKNPAGVVRGVPNCQSGRYCRKLYRFACQWRRQ
jgi:hypothetical protein